MKVDPGALRKFAETASSAGDSLANVDVSSPFADSQGAMPGTEFAAVGTEGYEVVAGVLKNICIRLSSISDIARGSANNYEVSESDFTSMLDAMDVPS